MNSHINEYAIAREEQRLADIWRIQQAAKRSRRIFDDLHPETIRERIKNLQQLLADAGV